MFHAPAQTFADQTDLMRRGIVSADAGHGTLPLRIAVPKPLWRNIPCAREPLSIQISLEAVSANGTINLHARAHRLFPADGARVLSPTRN